MPELIKTILKDNANLKAYYRFESGALTTDSSGNGRTLSAYGTPTENASGKFGGAVTFNGSNNGYNITDHADLKPTGSFSIGCWVNFTTVQSGTTPSLVQSWNFSSSKYAGIRLIIDYATGKKVEIESGSNTGAVENTNFKKAASTTDLNNGVWHFVVGTWDQTNLRLYVDGKCDATSAWANAPGYAATNFPAIGTERRDTGYAPFNGSIDEAFIINGAALSADQIKELYEGRYIGEWMPQTGLVAGYHLNSNGNDFSGNNLHLTASGGAAFSIAGKISGCVDHGTGNTGKLLSIANDGTIRGGACSLLCWINTPTTTSANDHETFFGVGDAGTRVSYNIFLGSTGIGAARLKGGVAWQETAQFAISSGVWYFVALTYDTTNVSLYINGQLIGQQAASGSGSADVADSINIGARTDTGAGVTYSDGKVDEAIVFSRALTAAEIRHWFSWSVGKYI